MDLQRTLAAESWRVFQRFPTKHEFSRPCHPPWPQRNRTVDLRNLSAVMFAQVDVNLRRARRCEQPSLLSHLRRLDATARLHGYRLKVMQIGANQGGDEPNEWVGRLIRRFGWNATLVEPVPQLASKLRENYAPQIARGNVSVRQLVVHSNRSAISRDGQCSFFAARAECVAPRPCRRRRLCNQTTMPLAINFSACPDLRQTSGLMQMGHPPSHTRPGAAWAAEMILRARRTGMRNLSLPCSHINDLAEVATGAVDVLVIDTEGFDFALLRALNLTAVRPIIIEFESKAFTYQQHDEIQRKLEAHGYRVFDANAAGEAQHWLSSWQVIETFAIHTGAAAPQPIIEAQDSGEDMLKACEAKVARRSCRPTMPRLKLTEDFGIWCRCRSCEPPHTSPRSERPGMPPDSSWDIRKSGSKRRTKKTQTFQLAIPTGVSPGQQFRAKVNGQVFAIVVPPGMSPGQLIRIQVPVKGQSPGQASPPTHTPATKRCE